MSTRLSPYLLGADSPVDTKKIRLSRPRATNELPEAERPGDTPSAAGTIGPVIRAYDAVVDDVNKVDRTLVAKINTSGVDRYRTVIDPRGGRLENYRKNAVVLWEHGKDARRFTDPIGRNVWIKHNGGARPTQLLARTKFLEDDFSQQRFEWYRDGVLNAFSVNILPAAGRTGPPTREELRDAPDWEAAELVYREWDLAEYSGTVVPGNADCLAERAAAVLDLVQRNLLWLPDDVRPLIEEAAARAAEQPSEPPAPEIEPETEAEPPALPDLAGARSIVEIAREMAAERRDMQRALRDEVVAMIDLLVYGRV